MLAFYLVIWLRSENYATVARNGTKAKSNFDFLQLSGLSIYCDVRRPETFNVAAMLLFYTFTNSSYQSISFPHYILTAPMQEIIHETASGTLIR